MYKIYYFERNIDSDSLNTLAKDELVITSFWDKDSRFYSKISQIRTVVFNYV